MLNRYWRPFFVVAFSLGIMLVGAAADHQEKVVSRLLSLAEANPRLELARGFDEESQMPFVAGTYRVFENRAEQSGREIELYLAVLPARSEDRAPDPIFHLHGGPGAPSTIRFRGMRNSWLRERRDIVLVDQRGTGKSNPLHVPGSR